MGDGNQAEITNPKIGMMGREALADPGAFWASAGEALPWRRRWDAVFDWTVDVPAGWHAVRFSVSTGGAASAGVQLSNVRLPAPSVIPGYPVQVNG